MERVERESGRHYKTPLGTVPSVTTILAATKSPADREGLARWKRSVGSEKAERVRQEAATRGTYLHESIERRLRGEEVWRPTPQWRRDHPWKASVEPFMRRVNEVYAVERPVWHSLGYAGTADLFAEVDGQPTVVDWKSSRKRKSPEWIGDYLLQAIAYLAAWNECKSSTEPAIAHGIVVVAYADAPADEFKFGPEDLPRLGREWGRRLAAFECGRVGTT